MEYRKIFNRFHPSFRQKTLSSVSSRLAEHEREMKLLVWYIIHLRSPKTKLLSNCMKNDQVKWRWMDCLSYMKTDHGKSATIRLAYLLCFPLISTLILMIYSTEIGDYDRDWKGNDKHTAQGTNSSNYFASYGFWNHVTVPVAKKQDEN